MGDQLGVTGQASYWGIPATSVAWAKTGGGTNTLTIFSDITKEPLADIGQSRDNSSELQSMNRTNKRIGLRFSAVAKGATAAAAQAIAADLPFPMDALTITAASDTQAASVEGSTILCDSASARWSPDGELVVDFTATKYIGKAFVALAAS